jgi:hypothetical protein
MKKEKLHECVYTDATINMGGDDEYLNNNNNNRGR